MAPATLDRPKSRIGIAAALALLVLTTTAEARDPEQVRLFRKDHPCPATGKSDGACPGWVVDHAYPLCAGGLDAPSNMQWQMAEQSFAKDRIERELCACKARAGACAPFELRTP